MQLFPILQALILLTSANGTPVIVKKIAGHHLAFPLDGRLQFLDGRLLFGKSKTIRGVVASIAITAGFAPLLGLSAGVGTLVAVFAMIGDLFSNFLKRRLGFPPSTPAIGLDQIPESLFPLLVCQRQRADVHRSRNWQLPGLRTECVASSIQVARSRSALLTVSRSSGGAG